jgi:hypothetical protein
MRRTLCGLILVLGAACATEPASSGASRVLQLETCSGRATDPFVLGSLTIEDDELQIQIATGGGCASHSFAICWDGAVLDSEPPQANLALSHDSHGDTCDAFLMHDVRVDVAQIRAELSSPIVLHVTGAVGQLDGTSNSVTLP